MKRYMIGAVCINENDPALEGNDETAEETTSAETNEEPGQDSYH